MTRIILTVGCIGKTYADRHYANVYDFDKHTLDYKWDRTGFENLSDEQFKGLSNRKERENWFDNYMNDWCNLIDSQKYDVITGWLQEDCVNFLLGRGYKFEVILVDCLKEFQTEKEYYNRSKKRGNTEQYWKNLRKYYYESLKKYSSDKRFKIWILTKPIYLSQFLETTGSILLEANSNQKVSKNTSQILKPLEKAKGDEAL